MNTNFIVKQLQYFYHKKNIQGFTLIELLIVIIILGVLASIGLPNLLSQVGKAREAEAKNMLGALNRAQQSYFTERAVFAGAGQIDNLEVPTSNSAYYTYSIVDPAIQKATGIDNLKNGTRDFLGGVQYSTDTRTYHSILCRSTKSVSGYDLSNTDVLNAGVDTSSNTLACNSTNAENTK